MKRRRREEKKKTRKRSIKQASTNHISGHWQRVFFSGKQERKKNCEKKSYSNYIESNGSTTHLFHSVFFTHTYTFPTASTA